MGSGRSVLLRGAALVATAALMVPTMAFSQSGSCSINDGSPFQINSAKQYVGMAANSRRPDEVPRHLMNSIRVLTENPDKINNEAGRQDLLARTYVQWLRRDGAPYVMKRKDVGLTTNPEGNHDLLLAIDTAVTTLDRLAPECKSRTHPYRDQFTSAIYNKAVTAMQADQSDSAVYFAKLVLRVNATDPRPWNVLSAVYQKQNKMDSVMIAMDKVIALSGTDTLYKKVKQQSRYNLAVLTLTSAEQATGEERAKRVKTARGLLEDYLKDTPGDPSATQALGRTLRMSGDTTAVANIFGDMLKSPANFTADQLFEAASNAAASKRDADAATLFENGLKKNPFHRNALYNLSNVLFQMKDAERMGPVVRRLTDIDPNYDAAWRLVGGYWQLRARAEADPAKKKVYNDSVLFYVDKQQKTNPRVDLTPSSKAGKNFLIQGSVTNEGAASASWTLKLELLDEAGAVVGTREVPVGPLAAGSSMSVSVTIESPKAVGYRYAPLK